MTLTADDLAALTPVWRRSAGDFLLRAVAPDDACEGLRTVQHALSLNDIEDLALLVTGIADGSTRATDAGGYTVEGDDVVVWDAGDREARVSRVAFAALIARLADVALEHRHDAVARAEAWAALEEFAAAHRR